MVLLQNLLFDEPLHQGRKLLVGWILFGIQSAFDKLLIWWQNDLDLFGRRLLLRTFVFSHCFLLIFIAWSLDQHQAKQVT